MIRSSIVESVNFLESKRKLIIAPHYDDEVLGCGGLLSKFPNDSHVMIMCGRSYEHKSCPERTSAAIDYAGVIKDFLGYKSIDCHKFYDEFLGENFVQSIAHIEMMIRRVKPELVFIPHYGDINQDHIVTRHAAMIACRGLSIISYFIPSGSECNLRNKNDEFAPNLFLRLTNVQVDAKIKAMSMYQDEFRKWPNRRSEKGIRLTAEWFGSMVGLGYAEAYCIERLLY